MYIMHRNLMLFHLKIVIIPTVTGYLLREATCNKSLGSAKSNLQWKLRQNYSHIYLYYNYKVLENVYF